MALVAILFTGLFFPGVVHATVHGTTLAGGRLQNVAFAAVSPGVILTVKSSKASLSKFGDIFAAGDAQLEVEIDHAKQTFHCRHLSIQMIDNQTTCELEASVKKTLIISATSKTIRSY